MNDDIDIGGDLDRDHQDRIEAMNDEAREAVEEEDFDGLAKEQHRRDRDAGDYVDDGSF